MRRSEYRWAGATLLLLAGYLTFCITTLPYTAPTFDEVAHLPAGYAALLAGRPVLNLEHPPLAKMLAAAALPALVPPSERIEKAWVDMDEWTFGRWFLFQSGRDPQQLMAAGRVPLIALGLILCLVVAVWSRQRNGPAGALVSLALCASSPTLLAHARLVTTDVPVAVFGTLGMYLAWRCLVHPGWINALATGLSFGAAMASKFTGILFPAAALAAAVPAIWTARKRGVPSGAACVRRSATTLVGQGLLVLGAACLVIGLSYGSPLRLASYVAGFSHIGFNHTPGYAFYLLGHFSQDGFLAYFPVALLLKSSPVLLVVSGLWALFGIIALRHPSWQPRAGNTAPRVPDWPFLLVPAVLYVGFVVLEAPDIGVRYLIPALPFWFVAIGGVGTVLWRRRSGRFLLAGLAVWQVSVAVAAWPDPISYFNGIGGCRGPGAIACLDDSNLDWGQDLVNVSRVVDPLRRPGDTVRLLYFGTADPRAYLKNFRTMRLPEMASPAPALYVVSLHRLNRMIRQTGQDWLSRYTPVAQVGRTYLVYDFRDAPRRTATETVVNEGPGAVR